MPFHAQNSLIYSMFYRNLCNYFDIIPLFYFILFSCIIDLLFSSDCLTADLGRTAVIDKTTSEKGAYINQHLCLIRLNTHEVDPVFLSAFLESQGGQLQFKQKDQVGVKSGLNFDTIKSIIILVPPLTLQRKYVNIIKQIEIFLYQINNNLLELEDYYKLLMQRTF